MNDWQAILREHGQMVFDTAWRILGSAADAEDAAQEAFVDAVRIGQSEGVGNPGALLRRLVTCRALDLLRRRRGVSAGELEQVAPARDEPMEMAAAGELAERLRGALARLPARQAEVFWMRYFDELGAGEIARELGMTANAVGVALHKAREKLAELLKVQEEMT